MKITEFRKLIREEVRKVINEVDLSAEMSEIAEYFKDYNVMLSPRFDLKVFAKDIQQSPKKAAVLLCNLEDTKVMKDIAKGVYDSFDMFNDRQFNDSYDYMMRDLNIRGGH
jgi:hypothetical protein